MDFCDLGEWSEVKWALCLPLWIEIFKMVKLTIFLSLSFHFSSCGNPRQEKKWYDTHPSAHLIRKTVLLPRSCKVLIFYFFLFLFLLSLLFGWRWQENSREESIGGGGRGSVAVTGGWVWDPKPNTPHTTAAEVSSVLPCISRKLCSSLVIITKNTQHCSN